MGCLNRSVKNVTKSFAIILDTLCQQAKIGLNEVICKEIHHYLIAWAGLHIGSKGWFLAKKNGILQSELRDVAQSGSAPR